jgi:Na+(H+)/acetate symporter ActP
VAVFALLVALTAVGLVALVLGILFARLNVNYLVGWAFSVAASANLPALVMPLFWKGTTRQAGQLPLSRRLPSAWFGRFS